MRTTLITILFLFYGAAFANVANDLKIKLHFSLIANLVYQLDCISGELQHCSKKTYQDLWDKTFIKNDDDKMMIKKWGELMNRYRAQLELEDPKQQKISGRFEGVKLSTKIRIASFQSMTTDEYFTRLDLVVIPKDREKFEEVIRRFNPEFNKWWKEVATPKGESFAKETDSLLKSRKLTSKIRQFAQFYGALLPENYVVHFNLFYRPDFAEATSGQQIENYSVTEFLPIEKPTDRIDVIIHELCHFFYENGSVENFVKLQKEFNNYGSVESRAAYNLLNETMATALGNGIINKLIMNKERWEKYSSKEQSFYNNYHIDKAAKSILPWIEEWVSEARTLYDSEFVTKYVSSLEKSFGSELSAPKLSLNQLVLLADSAYNGKFKDTVRQAFRASSMYTSEGEWTDERFLQAYIDNSDLSVLLIVHPKNINQLKDKKILNSENLAQLKLHLKNDNQVIYSFKRSTSASGYIIVAQNYEKALEAVEKIATMKQGFEGAYEGQEN